MMKSDPVTCKVGGSGITTGVTAEECVKLGGRVLGPGPISPANPPPSPPPSPPPPPPSWLCARFVSPAAAAGGFADFYIDVRSKQFVDDVLKKSKRGRHFVALFMKADKYVFRGLRRNPSIIGDYLVSWVAVAVFLGLVLDPELPSANKANFSRVTYRRILKVMRALRRNSTESSFHEILDFFKDEFAVWVDKTPLEIRSLYLGGSGEK